ncbi:hypothetical protein Nepgr_032247 [Nepenthes gracilis]|uniref:Uncharacterized protein n=1 Tax=Nepenthes gracilis TaxID=150966 RepID=A0AAD3Y7Q9_NEPGR|nr:hypothetical protein Nepgr_032247 [Nepenthes gracilis]
MSCSIKAPAADSHRYASRPAQPKVAHHPTAATSLCNDRGRNSISFGSMERNTIAVLPCIFFNPNQQDGIETKNSKQYIPSERAPAARLNRTANHDLLFVCKKKDQNLTLQLQQHNNKGARHYQHCRNNNISPTSRSQQEIP